MNVSMKTTQSIKLTASRWLESQVAQEWSKNHNRNEHQNGNQL